MAYFRCGGGLPTQAKAVTATTSQQIVTPDDGNVLESVTVNPQNHADYYPSASTYYNVSGSESINLGANHNYRYVRVKGLNPSGTKTITTRSSSIDVESYKYADTTGVPNSNSGTWSTTITSNGTKDLGASHSFRYVNVNVPHTLNSTVLWTMPSSTTFAEQTITCSRNLYEYDFVSIMFCGYKKTTGTTSSCFENTLTHRSYIYGSEFPNDEGIIELQTDWAQYDAVACRADETSSISQGNIFVRYYEPVFDGSLSALKKIWISDAKLFGGTTVNNRCCYPYQVVGYKYS